MTSAINSHGNAVCFDYFCTIYLHAKFLDRFMADDVAYCGVVKGVCGDKIVVSVAAQDAGCHDCAVLALCSGRRDADIELNIDGYGCYSVGDRVRVHASEGSRWRAIVVCLLLPLSLVFGGAALAWVLTHSDVLVAFGVIAVSAVYFTVIRLLGIGERGAVVWIVERYE